MLTLHDDGIQIEQDWKWPVSIASISDNGRVRFYVVWCSKEDQLGLNCDCEYVVGTGRTKEAALDSWRFRHFERQYKPKRWRRRER